MCTREVDFWRFPLTDNILVLLFPVPRAASWFLFSCQIPFSCSPSTGAASRFLFSSQIPFSCSPSPAP